ncbi:MAG: DUF4340 domain-containing protein [Gammaproteobacteria bacterium]|nr:DUF4340 domain-containing protein [Gammaproteobacteria bacterium]
MQHKHLAYLAVGVLVLSLAASFSLNKSEMGPATESAAILPGFAAAQDRLSELRVAGKEDKSTTLKQEQGRWLVAERGYPASLSKLRTLVDFLATAKIVEEKTALRENYEKLGVAAPAEGGSGTLVTALAGDKTLGRLVVGRQASATRGQFARLPDEAPSYLLDKELELGADPASWLDTALLDLPEAEVQRVEQGGSYVLTRERGASAWQLSPLPAGKQLGDSYLLAGTAGALAGLELVDVQRAPSAEFDQADKRSVRFYAYDGRVVELELAKRGEHALLRLSARFDEAQAKTHAPGGKLDEAAAKAAKAQVEEWAKRTEGWIFTLYATRGESLARPLSELVQDIPPPAKKP